MRTRNAPTAGAADADDEDDDDDDDEVAADASGKAAAAAVACAAGLATAGEASADAAVTVGDAAEGAASMREFYAARQRETTVSPLYCFRISRSRHGAQSFLTPRRAGGEVTRVYRPREHGETPH